MAFKRSEFGKLALENPRKAAEQMMQRLYDLHGEEGKSPAEDEIARAEVLIRTMKPIWEKVANPTEGMLAAKKEGDVYYDEAGEVSKGFGTIDEVRDNYHSARLYKSDPLAGYKALASIVRRFSAHGLARYYPNNLLALLDGKEFQSTSYADNLMAHNQEMTAVNYGRQMMNAMSETPGAVLGTWVREKALPPGWEQVGTASKVSYQKDPKSGELELDDNGNPLAIKQIFAAPSGIAKGLAALTDPNYLRNIPGWKTASTINGVAKTGILSFSFFHHYTFACQTLASFDGFKTLSEMPSALKNDIMSDPGFRALELRFLGANGSTTITHAIQDVMKGSDEDALNLSQVLKAPVAKQLSELSKANQTLLFDGMQRYTKVMTFSRNMSKWEGEHPGATPEEIHQAELGYAKATNAEFGGLNWEALGINRTVQALARFFLLAPDWVVSNLLAAKYAFTEKGTVGSQARWTLASAVLGGLAFNNALNYMRTGHSSFENKKGHELETEISPDIYTNAIRGAPGELMKLGTDLIEDMGASGLFRYIEGKASPILSGAITALTGREMTGGDIWKGDNPVMKNVVGFWHILTHMTPMPMAAPNAVSYMQREPADERSAMGWGALLTGLGRFSKSGNRRR